MVIGFRGPDRVLRIALRFGCSVGVECGVGYRAAARPESRAAALVRIGLTGDRIRAFTLLGAPAGEACNRKVETAPEKVDRASLSKERTAKFRQYAMRAHEDAVESADRIRIV